MSYSINSYVASGSQTQFAVTFPYISKTHVEVRLNSVLTTAYTWASSGVIQLNTSPAAGVVVDIRRNTPKDARLINFQDASTLIERDLDMDSDQAFYLAQEAFDAVLNNISLDTDGLFDAKSKRIKNVADPVNAQDAVTKTWAETAMTSQLSQATAQAAASATSAAEALVSKNAAAASATAAASSASTASTQAGVATTKASEASTSAAGALSSKNAAAVSETNAATSATQAAGSASAASGSASSANTSAVGAAASATTATTKASEASSSATSASGSAATATTKASDASNSASAAATSATNAAASATTASTKASEASASATSASGSATTATTKASEASASATSASGSASTATTKASEAAASAVSAANSAAAAATALDNFDDRYLGQKTADPTLDNDGMALLTGALYFNTTTGKMRVYTGSGWIDASSASVATLATFNYVATAGQTTFSGNDAAGVNLVYTVGALIVTLNGLDQKNGVDYTASNGSSIVLTSAAVAGDELRVYAFGNFQVADTYSQAAADAKFLPRSELQGFKNRIINGAMMIDQRNAGASVTLNQSALIYTTDRWAFGWVSSAAVGSATRGSGQLPLSRFAQNLTITTASTPSGNQTYNFQQRIEGFNVDDLLWGTASASPVTLSFKVQSSITGTFSGSLQNAAQNRCYPFTYTISSANTPTYISVTIPGDTTGTWATDNTTGIGVVFDLGGAGTARGSAGSWASAGYYGVTGAVNLVATLNATWQISEVQLEKGSTATSFDYRPYGTELALCQRYAVAYSNEIVGQSLSAASLGAIQKLPVSMRSTPTISSGSYSVSSGAAGTPALYPTSTNQTVWLINNAATWTTGVYVSFTGVLGAEL